VRSLIKENRLLVFARLGLIAKGLVYCLLSALVFAPALGIRHHKENKEGAFRLLIDQPFGRILLVLLSICMLGYVMLRCFQAVKGRDHSDRGYKSIFRRTGYAISALIYLWATVIALKLVFGSSEGHHDKTSLLQKVLQNGPGRIIVGVSALIIIGQGFYQMYKGLSRGFMKHVKLYHSNFEKTFKLIGIIGYVARGIVLVLAGYLLLHAAIDFNATEAEGSQGAFRFLRNKVGNWVQYVIALGLLAYGLFMFVRARHEKLGL
jgi:hypothetical protein